MNEFFNTILTDTATELSLQSAVITIFAALLLGSAVAFTYRKTRSGDTYLQSLAVTLFMLPTILSVIILFVGSNVARAFSLAGTLSIIRFRSNPGDAKDIGFIFFDIAAGLACGVGLFGYGALFVAILCAALFIVEKKRIFSPKYAEKILKITVPENLNYTEAFEDILCGFTKTRTITKVRTTDLGSLFEVTYNISMEDGADEREMINELRARNGNLTIVLSDAPAR